MGAKPRASLSRLCNIAPGELSFGEIETVPRSPPLRVGSRPHASSPDTSPHWSTLDPDDVRTRCSHPAPRSVRHPRRTATRESAPSANSVYKPFHDGYLSSALRSPGSPSTLDSPSSIIARRHTTTIMNPYGQQWQQGGAAPSIFGALPSAPMPRAPNAMQADSVTFSFTNFKTTILNSTILGPQGRTAFRVVTEPAQPACTIVKDNESRTVAMVHWQPAASLEIRGVASRQRVRDWLRLSSDMTYATHSLQSLQLSSPASLQPTNHGSPRCAVCLGPDGRLHLRTCLAPTVNLATR